MCATGRMLKATLPATAAVFGRAIIMPNLVPPVRTLADLARLSRPHHGGAAGRSPLPAADDPLSHRRHRPGRHRRGAASGDLTAVKLYPAGATTNSDSGVTDIAKVTRVLEAMQAADVPLLVHGEVTDPDVDIFDREAVFIERVLDSAARPLPGPAHRSGARHHERGGGHCAFRRRPPRRHHHAASSDDRPQRDPCRRHQAAFLLPADRQARRAPAGAGEGGDLRRPPLLPRHRFGAPSGLGQGMRLRRGRHLLGAGGAQRRRPGVRRGKARSIGWRPSLRSTAPPSIVCRRTATA